MKKETSFFANIIRVTFSNAIILVSQVLVGLVLPKIMSVNDFGLYRKFMLYATYAALLHFGFVDGILMKYGGKDENEIDVLKFRAIIRFYILFELLISFSILLCSWIFLSGSYKEIFLLLSIYSFFLNLVTFYQFFSQATLRFNILSKLNELQGLLVSCIIMFFLYSYLKELKRIITYTNYICLFIGVYFVLFLIYVLTYRNFIFGKCQRIVEQKELIFSLFKTGILITGAYQLANVTLNLDNQFVSLFFSNKEFAIYSFSYNLVSIIISVVLAISTVLFPYLNKQGKDKTVQQYTRNTNYMLMFVYALLVFYYPISFIIKIYIPNYINSLTYFRILLPGVAITTSITTIVFNHYKVTNDITKYFVNGCVALLITVLLNIFCYRVFGTVQSLAVASLITLLFWYGIEDITFRRKYKIKYYWHYLYILFMMVLFEVTVMIGGLIGSILYIIFYIGLTYCLYPHLSRNLFSLIRRP